MIMSIVYCKTYVQGGIVLTASHNPGGIDNDFGIKFNCSNGGPAPDQTTNDIYSLTTNISQYKIIPTMYCPIDRVGVYDFDVRILSPLTPIFI